MTLTTWDEDLCKKLEPNVSTTRERFEALKELHHAAFSFFYYADLREVHYQQDSHILAVCAEGFPDGLQMGDLKVKVSYFFL